VTRFADPSVGFELLFAVEDEKVEASQSGELPRPETEAEPVPQPPWQLPLLQEEQRAPVPSKQFESAASKEAPATEREPKVISIDVFRKKS